MLGMVGDGTMTRTDPALRAREREHREEDEHGSHWWRCMPLSDAALAAAQAAPLDAHDYVDDPNGMDDNDMENTRYCRTHDYYEGPADPPCPGTAAAEAAPLDVEDAPRDFDARVDRLRTAVFENSCGDIRCETYREEAAAFVLRGGSTHRAYADVVQWAAQKQPTLPPGLSLNDELLSAFRETFAALPMDSPVREAGLMLLEDRAALAATIREASDD